jgi:hypothetical protein
VLDQLEAIAIGLMLLVIILASGLLVTSVIIGTIYLVHHGLGIFGLIVLLITTSWVLGRLMQEA